MSQKSFGEDSIPDISTQRKREEKLESQIANIAALKKERDDAVVKKVTEQLSFKDCARVQTGYKLTQETHELFEKRGYTLKYIRSLSSYILHVYPKNYNPPGWFTEPSEPGASSCSIQ